jgi:hypothetical protein
VFPLGEFLSPRVFYPQVVDRALGPGRLPLSFSLHTCNNFLQSGERRSDDLIFWQPLFRNVVNDHARQCRKFRRISSSLDRFFFN